MMKTFHFFALTAAITCGCASTPKHGHLVELAGATVESLVEPAAYSGGIATYAEIRVKHGGKTTSLFYPYFSGASLPSVGAVCTFYVEAARMKGVAGEKVVNGDELDVAREYKC
jgi:hypothetical protein